MLHRCWKVGKYRGFETPAGSAKDKVIEDGAPHRFKDHCMSTAIAPRLWYIRHAQYQHHTLRIASSKRSRDARNSLATPILLSDYVYLIETGVAKIISVYKSCSRSGCTTISSLRTTTLLLGNPSECLRAASTHTLRYLTMALDVAPGSYAVAGKTTLDTSTIVQDGCRKLSLAGCSCRTLCS